MHLSLLQCTCTLLSHSILYIIHNLKLFMFMDDYNQLRALNNYENICLHSWTGFSSPLGDKHLDVYLHNGPVIHNTKIKMNISSVLELLGNAVQLLHQTPTLLRRRLWPGKRKVCCYRCTIYRGKRKNP